MITERELRNRFTYHPPKVELDQISKYEEIRSSGLAFARFLLIMTPESREQSLAITKLEESMFWANAAVARNEVGAETYNK